MLVDGAPVGDEREPARGVVDLLTVEQDRVETLPGSGIAGLEIAGIEADPAGAQACARLGKDLHAQAVELLTQQPLGAVTADSQGAHPGRL
jgi:hypothetical protein